MRSKQSALRKRAKRPMPASKIDFSDIPESTASELKRARRVGRPKSNRVKQLIAIRLDPELLAALKKRANIEGKPYQALVQEILSKAIHL